MLPIGRFLSKTSTQVRPAVSVRNFATVGEVVFPTRPYKLHKLDAPPSAQVTVTKSDALQLYEQMLVLRRMETSAGQMYREKLIRGFCHLYSGQEAIAVGMKAAMRPDDHIITAYRCHGWTYLMGASVTEILAELAGRVGGNVYGKGGSMHMYAKNYYGGNGIVGAQQPLGAGVALAIKYKGIDGVCMALYGDGAANQGQLYEAMNMAKLWDLPCIFICENNGFGMGTSVERASASTDYYTRGDYVPGIWVDAMDVVTVKEATKYAINYARTNGPMVMEMATYRYHGHSMSDPGTSYRTREEVAEVRQSRDPITGFKDRLVTANLVTEDELKEIETRVRKLVEDSLQSALKQPEVPLDALYTDIQADTPDLLIRGCTPDFWVKPKAQTTAELLLQQGDEELKKFAAVRQ